MCFRKWSAFLCSRPSTERKNGVKVHLSSTASLYTFFISSELDSRMASAEQWQCDGASMSTTRKVMGHQCLRHENRTMPPHVVVDHLFIHYELIDDLGSHPTGHISNAVTNLMEVQYSQSPPPPPTNARLNFYLPIKCKPLCFLQSTQGIIDTRNVVGIFLVDIIIRQKSMPNSRNGVGIHYDVAGIYAKSNFLFSLTQWEKPKARLHTLLPTTDDQLATLCQQTCLTYLQTV